MDRSQETLGHRRFGQRQKLCFVQSRLRALRFRIKFSYCLNLIAEKLDAHRPVRLGGIYVQNSATPRELSRHLHQVHLRVAHRGKVPGEHFYVYLFATPQRHREPRVVVAIKELQRRGLHRRNQNQDCPGGQLPQCCSALLLNVRMRG